MFVAWISITETELKNLTTLGACLHITTVENLFKPNWTSATWFVLTATEYEPEIEGQEMENINQISHDFVAFPKMARLSREVIISEKIDGTNAQIFIHPLGDNDPIPPHSMGVFDHEGVLHSLSAGSRTRWITPKEDNHGFAAWVAYNFTDLTKLGPGRHFGEWWGSGIQRKYGMTEKRWSLFNVMRWCEHGKEPQRIPTADPRVVKMQEVLPKCCHLVPKLYQGVFSTDSCEMALSILRLTGSKAAPGFTDPEGIVVFHIAGNVGFKKTLKNDEEPKGVVRK